MAPEWIKRAQEALERNARLAKIITAPTEAVDMGGDGEVVDLGEVIGRNVAVEITPGIEIKIGGRARIVRTAQGGIMAVAGGHEQPVTVFDAGKILRGRLSQEARRAVGRDRQRKKRNLPRP